MSPGSVSISIEWRDHLTATTKYPLLVGISGKKFSGKSTLAKALRQHIWNNYDLDDLPEVGSFAGALKRGCYHLGIEIDGPNKDVEVLQHIGVYLREKKGEYHWIDTLFRDHEGFADIGLIVDDCRFPNEFHALSKEGFLMVRCEVSRATQIQRAAAMGVEIVPGMFDHISETALDTTVPKFDLILTEDMSVADRVVAIIQQWEFLNNNV